jgi:simple sugar transport system permease protein
MILHILGSAAPLILAGLGGLLTEQAGILNIALEGMILGGAFSALLTAGLTGSLPLALTAAALTGILTASLFNLSSFTLKGNPFIAGLGINILVPALTASLSSMLYGNQGIIRPESLPALPRLGGIDLFSFLALGLAAAGVFLLYRTGPGLLIRACGEKPDLLKSRGVNPDTVRKASVLMSGILAALAGAALSLRLGVYVPGMSAGKGWIALVAIFLGYRRIPGLIPACLFFALAEGATNRAQGVLGIPPTLILSFPYFLTLGGLWLFSFQRQRNRDGAAARRKKRKG